MKNQFYLNKIEILNQIILDKKMFSGLMLAVMSDDIERVQYFMNNVRFNPDQLMWYCQSKRMVQFLVEQGAEEPACSIFFPCWKYSLTSYVVVPVARLISL